MKKHKKPIKIITLDTETYNGLLGRLKRIAIYDGITVTYGYKFQDVEKVLIGFFENGFDVHVYIHNLEFDARKIPEIFRQDIIEWGKCCLINNKFAKISTKYYTIHDSFKLLPMSLKKLSKSFEVENGKLDLWEEVQALYPEQYTDIVDFLDRCHVDNELYLKYLGYDVISLYEVLYKFMDLLGITEQEFITRLSTASISRYIFQNGYKGKAFQHDGEAKTDYEMMCLFKWHNGNVDGYNRLDIEDKIRQSYFGGRTEVFKPMLQNKGFHYDVNSLYPSRFKLPYPIGKPEISVGEYAKNKFEKWQKFKLGLGFVKARVFIPMQHIPPLPVRMSKLVFPCGEVIGTWTYNELDYAIKECGVEVLEIYETIHFPKTFPIFANFVQVFYKMKEDATKNKNEALRTLAKLILNVAYGYTGMRRDDKSQLKPISEMEKHKDEIMSYDEDLGFIEIPSEIHSQYIQVQIASYVTSYARLVLLDALRSAEKSGANVYYCDTDSIVTDKPLPDSIVSDTVLGKWKLESTPDRALFLRPKVYVEAYGTDTTKKFKGVSRETIGNDFEYDTYEFLYNELCELKHDSVIVEKNRTMLNSIIVLQKEGKDYDYYELREKRMNLKTTEKRVMYYKENYTEPLFFKSLEEFENYKFVTKKSDCEIELGKVRK